MPKSNLEIRIDQLDKDCAARDEDLREGIAEILERLTCIAEAVSVPGVESEENEGPADVQPVDSEPEAVRTATETVAAPKAAAAAKLAKAKADTGDTPPLDLGE